MEIRRCRFPLSLSLRVGACDVDSGTLDWYPDVVLVHQAMHCCWFSGLVNWRKIEIVGTNS